MVGKLSILQCLLQAICDQVVTVHPIITTYIFKGSLNAFVGLVEPRTTRENSNQFSLFREVVMAANSKPEWVGGEKPATGQWQNSYLYKVEIGCLPRAT